MVLIFTLTVFLSACLLFSVQPMVAKTLLPVFGGGSSVWTTCMLFYQTLLLLGYLYAHVLMTRFGRNAQMIIHSIVLVVALVAGILYDTPTAPPQASTFPVPWLILQLLLVSGLPFFAISSAGPLIQGWFARTGHHRAHDPYFLYAASNAGSLIGLLAYPLVFEPNMGVSAQRQYWLIGLGIFIFLAIYAASRTLRPRKLTPKEAKRARKAQQRMSTQDQELEARAAMVTPSPDSEEHAHHQSAPITWRRRLLWVYLAFVPSSILLGVTSYITTDVVSLPLLWVLPLALYLVTMIIAFGAFVERAVKDLMRPMVILVIGAMVLIMANELNAEGPMVLIVIVELLLLFVIGVVCHGRLAMDRPAATHLTEFYLLMSVGGALGGLFNGIVAPLVFETNMEYPIALVLAVAVLPWSTDLASIAADKARRIRLTRRAVLPLASLAYVLMMGFFGQQLSAFIHQLFTGEELGEVPVNMTLVALISSVPPLLVYLAWKDGLACALTILFPMIAIQYNAISDIKTIYRTRTFYGIHEVTQQSLYDAVNNRVVKIHVIHHGTTIHGIQYLEPDLELQPLGYYHFLGPCGMIMNTIKTMRPEGARIGIMGLGSGAIAAHGRKQDTITFFEIDPAVEAIARDPELFTFLQKAPADIEVRLGDGRKLIEESEEMGEAKYDLLHADAFSSDSIPTHLLTVEAINLYFDRLTDDGVVVLHISNRYLDLMPLVFELAVQTTPYAPLVAVDANIPEEQRMYRFASVWVVLTRNPETAERLLDAGMESYVIDQKDRIKVWTDDYSNIISLIKWR
jgi:spermidine synthase/MFS family permease